ncbi:hypothetical protein EON79_15200 [bacterium]|nr:MAG: hypothetical protein EON79_15200 [bacterium]
MAYTRKRVTEVGKELSMAVAILWLPGFGQAGKRSSQAITDLLRRAGSVPKGIELLLRAGHRDEAAYLCDDARWAEVERWHAEGRFLTWCDEGYPARWTAWRFAPPALWREGTIAAADWVAGVGSRHITEETREFCQRVGAQAASLGHGLISGAAEGCDRALLAGARDAGGPTLAILPRGLQEGDGGQADCVLSARPRGEPFSTAAAMERNALIYAASELAFIGHARLRQGGTWHGATDALRRHLCRLAIPPPGEEPGLRALAALGASALNSASDLETLLRRSPASLF